VFGGGYYRKTHQFAKRGAQPAGRSLRLERFDEFAQTVACQLSLARRLQ